MVLSRFFRKFQNNNLVNRKRPANIRYTRVCNNDACAVGVREYFNKEQQQIDNDKAIAKAVQSFNTISYMNKLANKFDQESLDRKYAINLHNKINTRKIKGRGKNKTKKIKQKQKSKKLRKIRKNKSRVGKNI